MSDGSSGLASLRVAIADDHRVFAAGLESWLSDLGVTVVGVAGDARGLMGIVLGETLDVVIVDVAMPPGLADEGIALAEELDATHPQVGVLVVSSYREPAWAERLFDRRQQGVGYLLKDSISKPDTIEDALLRIARGDMVVDARISIDLAQWRRQVGSGELSPREMQVLQAMSEGRSNEGIAAALTISGRTVENHIRRIFEKLGLGDDRSEHARVKAVLWHQEAHGSRSSTRSR